MQVLQGRSANADGTAAVAEATVGWSVDGGKPDLILAFCSTAQDPVKVAAALGEKFEGTRVVGCTTAGEFLGKEHYNGHLVLTGIATPRVRCSTAVTRDLAAFDEGAAR